MALGRHVKGECGRRQSGQPPAARLRVARRLPRAQVGARLGAGARFVNQVGWGVGHMGRVAERGLGLFQKLGLTPRLRQAERGDGADIRGQARVVAHSRIVVARGIEATGLPQDPGAALTDLGGVGRGHVAEREKLVENGGGRVDVALARMGAGERQGEVALVVGVQLQKLRQLDQHAARQLGALAHGLGQRFDRHAAQVGRRGKVVNQGDARRGVGVAARGGQRGPVPPRGGGARVRRDLPRGAGEVGGAFRNEGGLLKGAHLSGQRVVQRGAVQRKRREGCSGEGAVKERALVDRQAQRADAIPGEAELQRGFRRDKDAVVELFGGERPVDIEAHAGAVPGGGEVVPEAGAQRVVGADRDCAFLASDFKGREARLPIIDGQAPAVRISAAAARQHAVDAAAVAGLGAGAERTHPEGHGEGITGEEEGRGLEAGAVEQRGRPSGDASGFGGERRALVRAVGQRDVRTGAVGLPRGVVEQGVKPHDAGTARHLVGVGLPRRGRRLLRAREKRRGRDQQAHSPMNSPHLHILP